MKKRIPKQFLTGFIIAAIIFSAIPIKAAIEEYICYKANYKVMINGVEFIDPDLPILNYKGSTYGPFRAMLETAGMTVSWNAQLGKAMVNNTSEGTKTWVTHNFSSGDVYVGEWQYETMNGQGTYTWTDGDIYVGEWQNGEMQGEGILTSIDGSEYVGEYQNSMKSGYGTYNNVSGDKYIGEWQNDKMHGQGTYTWISGDEYIGEWENGMMHGQGTYTYESGQKKSGNWANNIFLGN